jgi:hypothetical protein
MSKVYKKKSVALIIKNNKILSKIPIQTHEGVVLKDEDIPEILYITAEDIGFKDVIVQTTKKEIDVLINRAYTRGKDKCIDIFKSIWNNIKNVDVDKIYHEGGINWNNFMNDIVLFYVYRFIVLNKPMPSVDSSILK